MSTATRKLNFVTIGNYTVAATKTATEGELLILSGADNEVEDANGASDLGIGIAVHSAAAGQPVEVYHPAPIIPVKVGTGGATRGKKAVNVADGFTDAAYPHDSSGATDQAIYGIFMESGLAGTVVGMMPIFSNRGAA